MQDGATGNNNSVTSMRKVQAMKSPTKHTIFVKEAKCMGAEDDGAHVEYVNVDINMQLPIPD